MTLLLCSTGAAAQQTPDSTRRSDGLSLQPERKITFETTEGTYMNLDVSPDGSTIVFDLLGDIYMVSITGGEATRLTSGMAFDIQPVFSPDGRRIVFASDASGTDNLWSINVDGSDRRQVTRERERPVTGPEWAPDGEYLLARRGGDLWLYHRDGGAGMEISKDNLANGAFGPVFSPDGRYVYYSARAGNPVGHEQSLAAVTGWQVRRLDRSTGDIAQITAAPFGALRPRISPDGRSMVYGMRMDAVTGLRVRDLESDADRWLVQHIDRDNAERGSGALDLLPRYDFTPDGKAIIMATGGTFQRIDLETGRQQPIAFRARVEQELGPFVYFQERLTDEPVRVRNLRYASRSPDGQRMVFSALSKLWVMDLPSGSPRPLVEQQTGQFQPVFSPDGRWIAWVTWSDTAHGHVWRMAAGGGRPERLSRHSGYYMHPAWSPDGSRIAFLREDPAAFRNVWSRNTGRIQWIPSAGGDATTVSSAPSDNRLTFSPDGQRITYVAEVAPSGPPGGGGPPSMTSKLMSVRLDGTDKRTLANISAEAYEIAPSPDGRFVAFSVREDIFLAALPLAAEPPTIGETTGPGPVRRVTREGGTDLHWENDGRTLAWTFADAFYRIDPERVLLAPPDSTPRSPGAGAAQDSARATPQNTQRTAAPEPEVVQVQLSVPRHKPSGTVVLRGGDVITMNDSTPLRNAAVVVTDNRITWIGPVAELRAPAGARTIDVTGKTLMPGIIDVHAHLRPPRDVFAQNAWAYLANLAFGVTSTRDVSSSNDGFAYHELVEAGMMLGPRVYSTGRAMTTGNAKIESLEDARHMVRHYRKLGTNVIKQYMQPHRKQRQWVVQAAREERMNVTNEGGGDLRLDLTQVLDGYTGFEHALPIADLYGDVVRLIAESRTWYTPTLVVAYGGPTAEWYFYQTTNVHDNKRLARFTPHEILDRRTRRGEMNAIDEYHFPAVSRGAAAILKAGGNVALGAHGEEQGICAHWELWALQMGGLSNFDALRTATTLAAGALGFQQDLGTLEAGKLADLLVLDQSPLEDIRNSTSIRYVMKNGELFDAETLDMVWPKQVALGHYGFLEYQRTGNGGGR